MGAGLGKRQAAAGHAAGARLQRACDSLVSAVAVAHILHHGSQCCAAVGAQKKAPSDSDDEDSEDAPLPGESSTWHIALG